MRFKYMNSCQTFPTTRIGGRDARVGEVYSQAEAKGTRELKCFELFFGLFDATTKRVALVFCTAASRLKIALGRDTYRAMKAPSLERRSPHNPPG
jgi:hypothetical protein